MPGRRAATVERFLRDTAFCDADGMPPPPRAVASLVVATLSKLLLTTLAGADFMVGEIAAQRAFESASQAFKTIDQSYRRLNQ